MRGLFGASELPAKLEDSLSLVSMSTRNIGEARAVRLALFTGHGRDGGGGGRFCAGLEVLYHLSVDEPAGLDPPGVTPGISESDHFGEGGGAG